MRSFDHLVGYWLTFLGHPGLFLGHPAYMSIGL